MGCVASTDGEVARNQEKVWRSTICTFLDLTFAVLSSTGFQQDGQYRLDAEGSCKQHTGTHEGLDKPRMRSIEPLPPILIFIFDVS